MANQNDPKPAKRNPCLDEESTIEGIPGEMVNERYLQNLPLMRAKIKKEENKKYLLKRRYKSIL